VGACTEVKPDGTGGSRLQRGVSRDVRSSLSEAYTVAMVVLRKQPSNPALQRTVQQRLRRCRPAAELRRWASE